MLGDFIAEGQAWASECLVGELAQTGRRIGQLLAGGRLAYINAAMLSNRRELEMIGLCIGRLHCSRFEHARGSGGRRRRRGSGYRPKVMMRTRQREWPSFSQSGGGARWRATGWPGRGKGSGDGGGVTRRAGGGRSLGAEDGAASVTRVVRRWSVELALETSEHGCRRRCSSDVNEPRSGLCRLVCRGQPRHETPWTTSTNVNVA